ncbi:NADH-quinone oxidoreductase subunit J [Sphingomonas sanguinis]|uniref:NADH-quinone oxidoreductase subunit J n=1 Tax=Sphingomonas sanguinis TaxID=33051 RepID=A0ABU5LNQ2_9SPHN|nr:NADH-quinone oxidoreductase subunit J [Sphingomonas sanguinis]MDZ7281558.1 NADH-quinone oxidoreductase subunit J [Sphingomonas sanguinis]QXT36525.1 NADH-quinone oxidoreductase subunit J [Sphingomonas sanguinis]
MIQAIAFYIFATVVIVSAGLTIASRNPVHSVMWLILAFFNAAGLMVLCGAEFIAMLLVIVYVGAVAVLFLFVVMMLDIEVAAMRAGFARYLPLGLALAVALLAEVIIAFQAWSVGGVQLAARAAPIAPEVSNIQAIGNLLYTRYLFIFEGAGLVLLVAMIGAIVLTHRKRGGIRPQNIAKQNARQPHEAIRNINQPIGQGVEL